ncbi:MAG: hypothetical protein CSA18_02405 [Deltaproteobacteria bacterium]|nr:MAG: hypothetical protein CSB21_01060 [Deltaproteobacteria bacterium]PIE74979.1 MAG: hypothetical protein CSA18_02405 [Deltaproteobacteria bacterium]
MKKIYKYNKDKFNLFSFIEFSDESLNPIFNVILNSKKVISRKNFSILGGRAKIIVKSFPGIGMVVFKNYLRGGVISFFNKNYYLGGKKGIRPVNEIKFMEKISKLGIPVPEPVAAFYKGNCIYQGGIITKYINNSYNMAQYSIEKPDKCEEIFNDKFIQVFEKIIENKIYHPDFHPGNILISREEDIYVIDFDKAEFYSGLPFFLKEKMQERWNRGVKKHKLPSFLSIE